MAVSLYVYC